MEGALHVATECLVLRAEQAFEKEFKQKEFLLERQKLYREDVRDIVELTTSRMDLYNLGGALILGFCMSIFCENQLVHTKNPNFPGYLISLFMISNFCAIGFLTLAVWLSMHASVLAHSNGVRQLLWMTRLDVPHKSEIDVVRSHVLDYQWDSTDTDLMKRMVRDIIDFCKRELKEKLFKSDQSPDPTVSVAPVDFSAEPTPTGESKHLEQASKDEFERKHLEQFLERQHSWVCYDAYSRICMALGMNLWLVALSYYIVGTVVQTHTVSGIVSLFGVQLLSVLVLKIDFHKSYQGGETRNHPEQFATRKDVCAVGLLLLFPPLLTLIFAAIWPQVANCNACMHADYLASTITFSLHASWLWYVFRSSIDPTEGHLPKRLRAVVDVLSPDELQLPITTAIERLQHERKEVENTCSKFTWRSEECQELGSLKDALNNAAHVDKQSQRFMPKELQAEQQEQRNQLKELSKEVQLSKTFQKAFQKADRLWKNGRRLRSHLEVLHETNADEANAIFDKFKSTIVEIIECGEIEFTFEDREFKFEFTFEDLGENLGKLKKGAAKDFIEKEKAEFYRKQVEGKEEDATSWILLIQSKSKQDWEKAYESWKSFRKEPLSSTTQLENDAWPAQNSNRRADELPKRIVKYFILGCMCLWFLAAVLHIIPALSPGKSYGLTVQTVMESQTLESRQLHVQWPPPAPHFEVQALHCVNGSMLLVSSRFSLWALDRQPEEIMIGTLKKISKQPVATVLCHDSACNAIVNEENRQEERRLIPVTKSLGHVGTVLPVPATWRLMSALWEPCSDPYGPCESALLAGWTGSEIIVAEARSDPVTNVWHTEILFAVRPDMAQCANTLEAQASCPTAGWLPTYENVRALQLGQGRTLAVLLDDNHIDGWDLKTGAFLGQWRVGHGNYTAMCHGENEFVFVRHHRGVGPQLEVSALPAAFTKVSQSAKHEAYV